MRHVPWKMDDEIQQTVTRVASVSEQHRPFVYDGNQYVKRNQSVNMFLFFSTSKELS